MNGYPNFPRGRFGGGTFFFPGHGGAHPLEWAIFALVLALLLLSVATLALELGRTRRGPRGWRPAFAGRRPPPASILGARYARGEIGRDEFLQALDDLRGTTAAPGGDDAPTAERPPG